MSAKVSQVMGCLNPVLESERISERLSVCQREANVPFCSIPSPILRSFISLFGFFSVPIPVSVFSITQG